MWEMSTLDLLPRPDGVHLRVQVKPRSSRSRVLGVVGDALSVAIAAPPVDGAANAELIRVLARHFDVRPGAVRVVSGDASRRKLISIEGLSPQAVLARMP
jgi:uncharacterized protein